MIPDRPENDKARSQIDSTALGYTSYRTCEFPYYRSRTREEYEKVLPNTRTAARKEARMRSEREAEKKKKQKEEAVNEPKLCPKCSEPVEGDGDRNKWFLSCGMFPWRGEL
jgi:hypothetical protein